MSGLMPPGPLAYEGQLSTPFILRDFPPQASFINFPVPTIWVDTEAMVAYMLVSKALGVADWLSISSSSGTLNTLHTPDGETIVPSSNNINFLNGTGFNITGSSPNITISASPITITAGSGLTGGGVANLGDTVTIALSTPINVVSGGTGRTSLSNHAVLVGASASGITQLSVGSTGTLLVGATGADPAFASNSEGDFNFTNSTAATGRRLSVTNNDNTSTASNSIIEAVSGGATGGDAWFRSGITGVDYWSFGTDNSDSDAWVISRSGNVGANNIMRSTVGGQINYPLQPIFSAFLDTSVTNATGDGTPYTIVLNAEQVDVGSNFNPATGTFTAPVTGNYGVQGCVCISNIGAGHTTARFFLHSSTAAVEFGQINPAAAKSLSSTLSMAGSTIFPMTAGDTCTLEVVVSGSTKTITVNGSAIASAPHCGMSGSLLT